MNENRLTPAKPVDQLHFRINQVEVLASGRFTIFIVVGAMLVALFLF